MNDLTIMNHVETNNQVIESREIAKLVGKRHSDLLETIKGHIKKLLNGKFRSVEFFIESTYKDGTGRELPCFLVTKKGCELLANKMTGDKGLQFTAKYVSMFEKAVDHIEKQMASPTEQYQLLLVHEEQIQRLENRLIELENNTLISPIHGDEIQALYKAKVRELLGEDYKNPSLRMKAFVNFKMALKQQFGVVNYRYIKEKDYENVIDFISTFQF